MTGFEWFMHRWNDHCYGSQTDGDLRNTKGISISNHGVHICHWNEDGDMTGSQMYCRAGMFKIIE